MSSFAELNPGLKVISRSLLAGLALLVAVPMFAAQANPMPQMPPAMLGTMILVIALIGIAAYIYSSLALQAIAQKTKTENAWLAWVPILNIILMLNIARKPLWWIILLFVPLVNIVIVIMVWMAIAEARMKPSFWGVLMILPLVNIFALGYLAWSD